MNSEFLIASQLGWNRRWSRRMVLWIKKTSDLAKRPLVFFAGEWLFQSRQLSRCHRWIEFVKREPRQLFLANSRHELLSRLRDWRETTFEKSAWVDAPIADEGNALADLKFILWFAIPLNLREFNWIELGKLKNIRSTRVWFLFGMFSMVCLQWSYVDFRPNEQNHP